MLVVVVVVVVVVVAVVVVVGGVGGGGSVGGGGVALEKTGGRVVVRIVTKYAARKTLKTAAIVWGLFVVAVVTPISQNRVRFVVVYLP